MTKRISYILMGTIAFLIGVILLTFLKNSGFIRGFISDIAVIVFLYSVIQSILLSKKRVALIIGIVLMACIIEVSQYFKLIQLLGLKHNFVASLILGSTFDIVDFFAYILGGVLLIVIEKMSEP